MSARRPLQPLSPLAGNIVGAKYNYSTKAEDDHHDELYEREDYVHEDNASIVSGLTSLESGADEFERLMIQNARDERRLNNALQGKVQPFRKARTHPRVALTLDNLERNNSGNDGALQSQAHGQLQGPPSSSGSARSDPAIQPPSGWGRKGRVQRDWLRTAITSDEDQNPGAQEDTIDRLNLVEDITPKRMDEAAYAYDADLPVESIEDSPLSRKSSLGGTPSSTRRRDAFLDRIQDWDHSLEMNEASLIASTPYVPRNTILEDIRKREIESLREQAVTTSRLDKIRESSSEETQRPRSSSTQSMHNQINGSAATEKPALGGSNPDLRLWKRTNSWKTISKSQAVTGEGANQVTHSPVMVYSKSSETVGIINPDLVANAPTSPGRPTHRREDSHDLLRRLARVSSVTPSPARDSDPRPNSAPARQPGSSSQTTVSETKSPNPQDDQPLEKAPHESKSVEAKGVATNTRTQHHRQTEKSKPQGSTADSLQIADAADVNATPMPAERSILSAKTPVVTGAWVDTPAPRTSRRPTESSQSSSRSPRKGSPSKKSTQKPPQDQPKDVPETVLPQINRPTLPGSALEAIIEEARASKSGSHPDNFGDSTINSLEDLIRSSSGSSNPETGEVDEDTLLGLKVPTGIPRNEAERQRQEEAIHLHKMNERLKAARVSIRDTSRGMKRIEDQVGHTEGGTSTDTVIVEDGVKIIYRDCPCAHSGHQRPSLWVSFKRIFRDPNKTTYWGLTTWGILLTGFLVWFFTENIAWYVLPSPPISP